MNKRFIGMLSFIAGAIGVTISVPFSAAYFRVYPGYETPPSWLPAFAVAFPSVFDFALPAQEYQMYGRMFSIVIPLTFPGILLMKQWIRADTRRNRFGWWIYFGGAMLVGLGIIGDYWPDPDSAIPGFGFVLELFGVLVLWLGGILYGVSVLSGGHVPALIGWSFFSITPVGVLGMTLLAHIPSGPLLGYVISWVILGGWLMFRSTRNQMKVPT